MISFEWQFPIWLPSGWTFAQLSCTATRVLDSVVLLKPENPVYHKSCSQADHIARRTAELQVVLL